MRILILSDIHANITALETVLDDAGQVDAVWCLGDIVGYGPDPNECIARLQQISNLTCLQGNHDAAVVGDLPLDGFNHEARLSVGWQQEAINANSRNFLLALDPKVEVNGVTLAHASPRQPVFEYLLDTYSAAENFGFFNTDFCFVGHTHIPSLFVHSQAGVSLAVPEPNTQIDLKARSIVNPGSVGQPRDHDPRAAYAIFDDQANTWDYHRVAYDVAAVQQRMEAAQLPERHILRLAYGN